MPEPYDSFISALLGWYDAVENRDQAQADHFADRVLSAGNLLAGDPRFVIELEQRFKGGDASGMMAGFHAFLKAFNDSMAPRPDGM